MTARNEILGRRPYPGYISLDAVFAFENCVIFDKAKKIKMMLMTVIIRKISNHCLVLFDILFSSPILLS